MLTTLSFSFLLLTLYLVEDMRNMRHFRSTSMKKETRLLFVTIATYAILLLFPIRDIFVYNRASFHYGMDTSNEINVLLEVVKRQAHEKSVYVFSVQMEPGTSLENYSDVKLANSILGFWMLPGILQKSKQRLTPGQKVNLDQAKSLLLNTVTNTFKKRNPALVIIQTENAKTIIKDNSFSYIKFFSQKPQFKAIWKNYHFAHSVNDYAIYTQSVLKFGVVETPSSRCLTAGSRIKLI